LRLAATSFARKRSPAQAIAQIIAPSATRCAEIIGPHLFGAARFSPLPQLEKAL